MIGTARSLLISVPLLACSSSPASGLRPSDITSSTLQVGDATHVAGSLIASWTSVVPAGGESCEESRWLTIYPDDYGTEVGEVVPRVELAVPVEFESGALASMPTVPVESPLVMPGLSIVDVATSASSAFSGGSASWFDSGTGTLTFSLAGSELCPYSEGSFGDCAETPATLTMMGAVLRTDICYEGAAGPLLSPDDAPLCVIEDEIPIYSAPSDCEAP